jgi:hypothetical protein
MENVRSSTASAYPPCMWASANPTRTTTCAACSAIYPYAEWISLSLLRRIEPVEIGHHVLDWPEGVVIDVRRCARCGAPIARKRPATCA